MLRLAGFREAMGSAGIAVDEDLVVPGEFSFRSGFESTERLLQAPERPTAILASNDDMAAGAISAARQFHLRVPEDLSVCGFDDSLRSGSHCDRTRREQEATTIGSRLIGLGHENHDRISKVFEEKSTGNRVFSVDRPSDENDSAEIT